MVVRQDGLMVACSGKIRNRPHSAQFKTIYVM
jgi:hypothetical protein